MSTYNFDFEFNGINVMGRVGYRLNETHHGSNDPRFEYSLKVNWSSLEFSSHMEAEELLRIAPHAAQIHSQIETLILTEGESTNEESERESYE